MSNQEMMKLKVQINDLEFKVYQARNAARDLLDGCSCGPGQGIPPRYGYCPWCTAAKLVDHWIKNGEIKDADYDTSYNQAQNPRFGDDLPS